MNYKISKPDEYWKKILTSEQFEVCRNKGVYNCSCCGTNLFSSDTKFDSGTGWPSFFKPTDEENIEYIEDRGFGMTRIEVNCKNCGAHLGHVFDDGPKPTNLRYCINSISLKLDKSD